MSSFVHSRRAAASWIGSDTSSKASTRPTATHQIARRSGRRWATEWTASSVSRMSSSPPASLRSQARMPRCQRVRCACRKDLSSAPSSARGLGCDGAGGVRSGKKSSTSDASARPESSASSRYAGYSRKATFGSPCTKSSTNFLSCTTAWSMQVTFAAASALRPPKLFSNTSQKRVAPARPTMLSAPLTWCRCSGQLPSTVLSCGAAEYVAICERTRSSAWSTSGLIHVRVVGSAMGLALCDLEACDGALQPVCKLRQARRGERGRPGALGSELRHAEDDLHLAGDLVGRNGLLARRVRDGADELREAVRNLLDLAQRLVGFVRGLRPLYHAARAALHGLDRVLRIALNALHDGADVLRRLRRAL